MGVVVNRGEGTGNFLIGALSPIMGSPVMAAFLAKHGKRISIEWEA